MRPVPAGTIETVWIDGKRVTVRLADLGGRQRTIWRIDWPSGLYGETVDFETLARWVADH